VRDVRDDCFVGEKLLDLVDARWGRHCWFAEEYGMRRHTTTQRMPREHFEADAKPHLLPPPTTPYDIPIWCEPKVGAGQHAQVARSLYSLRFYDPVSRKLVKVHSRVAPVAARCPASCRTRCCSRGAASSMHRQGVSGAARADYVRDPVARRVVRLIDRTHARDRGLIGRAVKQLSALVQASVDDGDAPRPQLLLVS
jgi:hypothetical protein